MGDVVPSLIASVITGVAVWLGQWLLRYRRLARKRAFFGVAPGASCVLVAPRHFASPKASSVHRRDMAALVELATIVNECGARSMVRSEDGVDTLGRSTEFCVGGPTANARTAAHLRSILPGVRFESDGTADALPTFRVGTTDYPASSKEAEYVVLGKAHVPTATHPVFLIAGQTSRSNLAGARHLANRHPGLMRSYGVNGRFCLVLKVVEPLVYGSDFVEIVADVTEAAFRNDPVVSQE